MASLSYLWKNRVKHPFGSKIFFVSWAKRILTLRAVMNSNRIKNKYIRRGAKIDKTAEMSPVTVYNDKKNLTIGAFTSVGRAQFWVFEKVTIGNYVVISDGAILISGGHDIHDPYWPKKLAPIVVHDYAWIGLNALVMSGVTIGRGAVVGAGAVVTRDVADYEIVVGNPARPINKKRNPDFRYNPCEFLAGNMAWLKEKSL